MRSDMVKDCTFFVLTLFLEKLMIHFGKSWNSNCVHKTKGTVWIFKNLLDFAFSFMLKMLKILPRWVAYWQMWSESPSLALPGPRWVFVREQQCSWGSSCEFFATHIYFVLKSFCCWKVCLVLFAPMRENSTGTCFPSRNNLPKSLEYFQVLLGFCLQKVDIFVPLPPSSRCTPGGQGTGWLSAYAAPPRQFVMDLSPHSPGGHQEANRFAPISQKAFKAP